MLSKNFDLCYERQMANTYLVSREGSFKHWRFCFCQFCGKSIEGKSKLYCEVIEDEAEIGTEVKGFDSYKLAELIPDECRKKRVP
jgi:hypothetical protein